MAIGLKNKFILISTALFLAGYFIVAGVQYYLFRTQQIALIDDRLDPTAALLLKADLSEEDLEDVAFAENLIAKTVEAKPFNLFIRVYSDDLKLLYATGPDQGVPAPVHGQPARVTYDSSDGTSVRALFLPLPKDKTRKQRFIQVGILMDQALLASRHIGWLSVGVGVTVLVIWLLTVTVLLKTWLKPLEDLTRYIRELSEAIGRESFDVILRGVGPGYDQKTREFREILQELRQLSEKMSARLRHSKLWMAQMAHELKTPLAVLTSSLHNFEKRSSSEQRQIVHEMSEELARLSRLINAFLGWAEASYRLEETNSLHVISLSALLEDVLRENRRSSGMDFQCRIENTVQVAVTRIFLEQLISNLVDNAFKYSSDSAFHPPVFEISGARLCVRSYGPEIHGDVLSRLGLPFNYDRRQKNGHGLGLAWVKMVTNHYGLDLQIKSQPVSGAEGLYENTVTVDFTAVIVSPESDREDMERRLESAYSSNPLKSLLQK
ncbi:MAG: HAMP domain-containing histidine kinase [Bdellovibrionaceae bacterium]|nr:HAMP domain-containing histidine kinase [Pseudobdellovibrionaceae bacterium]